MGLDITAYSHLEHVGKHAEDWCDQENHVEAYAYDSFPRSFRGIPVLGTKSGYSATFLEGGCYAITDATKTHDFRAGSYSGYSAWRRNLAEQFNPYGPTDAAGYPSQPDPDRPFFELIWFADNEGTIGPEAAADLLADFEAHARAYQAPIQWYASAFADWHTACLLAADSGLIAFH